jgi:anti-sigma-K factor RskA
MNWYHSARAVNELAGQYVLGTLQGRARRRFEAVMRQRPEVAEQVASWEARLHRMAHSLPPVAPSAGLWETLARQAGLPAATAPAAAPVPVPVPAITPAPVPAPLRSTPKPAAPGLAQRLLSALQALLAPVPAGALAFGLAAGVLIPNLYQALNAPVQDTELPESYVGVLARPDGRPGLIVASLRRGRVVDLKQVSPVAPPPGQTLYLWVIDAQGQAVPVGPVGHGPFVRVPLPDTAESVFNKAVELGVTLEASGSNPAAPSAGWVYRGLCGKVWRVQPAAKPASAG